jgi:heat-inducible transcriptional repressor
VRLIASLTKQLAVVQYPSFGSARVRHVELVSLAPARVLCILIADSGQVEQRLVELEQPVDEETLSGLRVRLNEIGGGRTMADAAVALSGEIPGTDRRHALVLHTLATTLAEQARVQRTDRLVVAGAANLVRTEQDFAGSILDVIEAIEEQVVLLKLFGEMSGDEHAVAVRIGRENASFGLGETSIVSSAFEIPGRDVSRLGVVGPTRMDYTTSMAAVRAVARYLSRTLGES